MGGLRNETMADCGMRNGNVRSDQRAGLDPPTVALVRLAAALAEGKIAVLEERLTAARAAAVPDRWIEELLLQSLLVVGYPPPLVAFGGWREVAGAATQQPDRAAEQLAHQEWEASTQLGADVCQAAYGRAYPNRRLNLRGLDHALEGPV